MLWLGEAYLAVARLAEALAFADDALSLTRHRKEQGYEAQALHLQGELAAYSDPPKIATAEAHYGAAIVLASELGMRPLVAHCHLGLGKLYGRTGDSAKAHEHLTTATSMYREMGMNFWLEKAEVALRLPL
jgi:tetratricopeptide (TPR) repeat protein